MDKLTVVIPYRNEPAALRRLLKSLPPDVSTIVVDDVSTELPEVEGLRVRVIRLPRRGYFAGAVNAGIAACDTDVLVLNQDVWFDDAKWLDIIDGYRQKYAVMGDAVMNHPAWPMGYIQGTFMFMRRDALSVVGKFDDERYPLWGCTCEWQLRACRKGFRVMPLAARLFMHHEERHGSQFGAAITQALAEEPGQRARYIRTPPLVSVVIPTYNHGRYLPDALHSLLGGPTALGEMRGQTFQGFEVIVVDDASTDNTQEVMRQYADPWKGIRYVRHDANRGTAAALNTGIKASYGTYFQVLAADDMLEPTALEASLSAIEANPGRFVYPFPIAFTNGQRGKTWILEDYDFDKTLQVNQVPAGIMARKSDWARVGGYPEEFRDGREDWAMAVALGRAGVCGVRIVQPLYLYRHDGQNRSNSNGGEEQKRRFLQQMQARFPDVYGGERPMGCCGGSKRTASNPGGGAARSAGITPGVDRGVAGTAPEQMVLIEYIGANVGRTNWVGSETGIHYVFSGSTNKVKYVDSRDVPGLLAQSYDRVPAFRVYVAPPVPKPAPVVPIMNDEPVIEPETVAAGTEPVEPEVILPRRRGRKRLEVHTDGA